MIKEARVAMVQQIPPFHKTDIQIPQDGMLEIIGGVGKFEARHPGASNKSSIVYTGDQSLTIHLQNRDLVFQTYDEKRVLHVIGDALTGNSHVRTITTETHRLLPGETELINSPDPMRIIGGKDEFFVRCEKPGTQGPDSRYTTPLITHPEGPNGTVVIFDVFHPQIFQKSEVLDR